MRKISLKGSARIAVNPARFVANGLRYFHISPLWAICLSILCSIFLAAGLFALRAALGRIDRYDSFSTPEWKPPSLEITGLNPQKVANADVQSLSRPIFSKSRRPSPKAANPGSLGNGSTDIDGISVTAIVLSKKTIEAFFVSANSPEGTWRKVGDTVDAWTITAIAPKEITLQSAGQMKILKLYADNPGQINVTTAAKSTLSPAKP